jgi:DNA-binding YbaB/EbfC family protein
MNGFKGGFGGFGGANLQQLMKQAQKMQQDMEQAKQQIAATDFVGVAGGEMVKVVVSGERKVKSVSIKPQVVDPDDIEMLEDLMAAAFNDAMQQIEKMEKELLPSVPGMM